MSRHSLHRLVQVIVGVLGAGFEKAISVDGPEAGVRETVRKVVERR